METEKTTLQIGRLDYAERRAARIARLEARAAKASAVSADRLGAAHRIGAGIPFGQPILVGHHSERRARRDAEKIHDNMRKGVEAGKLAESLARRAAAAEESTAISSDNPEAVELLRGKVRDLEASVETMKKANKLIRKGATVESLMSDLGWNMKTAQTVLRPDFCGRVGFPPFELTNRGAEIRRCKKRIAELEARSTKAGEGREDTIGDVRIVWSVEENRVQIFYPGKPADAVRAELKAHGFKWAPSAGAWQRLASENSWQAARIVTREK
jgi:hypothetical protein